MEDVNGRRPEDPPGVPTSALDRLGVHYTFDTNIVDCESPEMERLRALDVSGWIHLSRTDTVDTELEKAKPAEKKLALLALSAPYVENLGPMVLDSSRFDHAVAASADDVARLDAVFRILWPNTGRYATSRTAGNKLRDAQHIATSIRIGATGFLTCEEDLLKRREEIRKAFDWFDVVNPETALAFVERLLARYWRRQTPEGYTRS